MRGPMEQAASAPRLRYLDAHDVNDPVVDYDGLEVRGSDRTKLGTIDGFIVDAATGRIQYFVVKRNGWARSRRVLIPIGHAMLSDDRTALTLDFPRRRVAQSPAFEPKRFREFTSDDMRRFERRMEEMEFFGASQPLAVACDEGRTRHVVTRLPLSDDDETPISER